MRRGSLLAAFIIGLFGLAWYIGYAFIGQMDRSLNAPQVISETQTPAAASPDTPPARTEQGEPRAAEFSYSGWRIDNSGETPKACLEFSHALEADSGLIFTDYIRTAPDAQITAEILGQQACLSGLDFSQSYEITILEGLKSADGKALAASQTAEISFGDRPPFVSFAGTGVILPRAGAQGLALETVNVDELAVEIYRVGDRILAQRTPDSGDTTPEGSYAYEYDNVAKTERVEIWSGTLPVKSSPNTLVTTVLPINELIGELKPGAYVVHAARTHDEDEYRAARAWRWIISTDMALTSYQGASGLDVTVRSITSAEPIRGVKIDLVAQNNEILGTAITDSTGRAKFAKAIINGGGPLSPRMLMAYGDNDYTVLDFNRAPIDMSAFPVGGRAAAGAIDAYVFAERGVYRPGETAHLTAMLRDTLGMAVTQRKGALRILKPNGIEFRNIRFEETLSGTLLQDFDIPASAPRGVWRAVIDIDGLGQVGSAEFSVEDFVPQQLAVDIKIDDSPLDGETVRPFEVSAQFLYGANGAGLSAEGEARIRIDPQPFPDFKDYSFGKADKDFREIFLNLGGGTTDGKGLLELGLSLKDENIKTSHPLRAEIMAGVSEPGGRYVTESTRIPVRTHDAYIGIDPKFDGRAERNAPATLNIIAVDKTGQAIDLANAEWILVEEDWNYNWYRTNGDWRYRRQINDIEIARGKMDIGVSGADITRTLDWGDYRLIVKGGKTAADAAYRFSVGWGGSSVTDTPDQIQIGAPNTPVKAGETITLSVKSPYAGIGELVIADENVRQIATLQIPEGGSEVKVKLKADLGAGVYALLSVYTPRTLDVRPVPRRAVGAVYLPANIEDQVLDVKITGPDVTKPRQMQKIKLSIGNIPRGETAYVTLAAVDTGILQITKYKSPDPVDWFFGKSALSIDIRDDYARLLNANLGSPALARSGGDSLGGEGLSSVPIKTVALYSGAVTVKNGKAEISLDLPDFNGELRLMASAWSKSAVGNAAETMKVRDAVPSILTLPRFLAPGDKAKATVTLDNLDGKAGQYAVKLIADGPLSIVDGTEAVTLAKGERQSLKTDILANQTGVSRVNMWVSGPGKYEVQSDFEIETRSPFFPITRMQTMQMAAGESYTPVKSLIDGLHPLSSDITVSFTRTPNLDPSAYAAAVTRYPYGCTEQTVSAAMPLLYANDLGAAAGIGPAQARQALQKSIDRIVSRQGFDGAFGLWSEGDGYAVPWVGVYAADFLHRAKEKDYVVPENILDKADKALKTLTKMERYPNLTYYWLTYNNRQAEKSTRQAEAAAYAHYVLARSGKGDLSAMRYFQDNHADKLSTPLGYGYLGAALSMMDDNVRAAKAFDRAAAKLGYQDKYDYYQSPLRDAAGLLALLNEAGETDRLAEVQTSFDDNLKPPNRLNTQEMAQTILAIRSFLIGSAPINISAEGTDLIAAKGVTKAHLYGSALDEQISFTNKSDSPVWRSVMVSGTPLTAPEPFANGFTLSKTIYKMDGSKADLSKVQTGQKLIVKTAFKSTGARPRQAVLADLLPAGMEIEAILPADNGSKNGLFPWLGDLDSFQTQEKRDDRLVAATETYRTDEYAIAYIVRAVTAGDFIWPGAVVQDMYRPADEAITASQRVIISSDSKG